jgi:hypothetical protein
MRKRRPCRTHLPPFGPSGLEQLIVDGGARNRQEALPHHALGCGRGRLDRSMQALCCAREAGGPQRLCLHRSYAGKRV